MTPCYLIEHTYTTTTGTLQGKTLRAYEVTIEKTTTPNGFTKHTPKPTGILYTIENGILIQKKTKATLNSKYTNYTNGIQHTMPTKQNWGCSLFSTPELALHYKATLMRNQTNAMITQQQEALNLATAQLAQIPDTSFIVSQHPELFI